jgi:hypothetical protein
MIREIFYLIFLIIKLVLLIGFSYKFLSSDMREVKTIYYGIWILLLLS